MTITGEINHAMNRYLLFCGKSKQILFVWHIRNNYCKKEGNTFCFTRRVFTGKTIFFSYSKILMC